MKGGQQAVAVMIALAVAAQGAAVCAAQGQEDGSAANGMTVVDSSQVPWKKVARPGFPDGQEIKPLHANERISGRTSILKFPTGYIEPRHYHTTGGHSAYILKGKMKMGDKVYGAGEFFYFPANVAHGPNEALEEVEALVWTDGPLDTHLGEPPAGEGKGE
ncbi:cupin domain-containing protein [Emcibacter nanhaiensis]|uniref:Cupin domain-containing protein n=1 Tax=Emcibacter nanhaiensis TaxID=1505037 RepID=A0A501PFJ9_9PROT|nr:cupin domain-containing protein [Emcibacter nanhaiensis]TPD58918.1 cupin domain-containing protein [Emcibacter nanhaiensis]